MLCLVEVTRGQSNEKLVFIGFFFCVDMEILPGEA